MKNKIIVNSSELVAACEYAKKVMTSRPTVAILENFLLKVDNGVLKVTASDLETSVSVKIKIEANEGTAFSACMPAESLKYLKKLNEAITLTWDNANYSLEFLETDGRAKYSGENAEDFPRVPLTDTPLFNLPKDTTKELKDLLNYTSSDELRPAMTGINFGIHACKFYLCATDGHTLKTVNIPSLDSNEILEPKNGAHSYFILRGKAAKILSESKNESDLVVSETASADGTKYVSFMFDSAIGVIEIVTRSIDEMFPAFFSVIPTDSLTQYTFDSKVFLKALDKAELFAHKTTRQVRLSLNGANKISAEDLDFSNEANFITGGSYVGNEIEIGFNAEFLKKSIKSFGDSVTLEMSAPNRAAVIRDNKSLVLCMPVMLTKYE